MTQKTAVFRGGIYHDPPFTEHAHLAKNLEAFRQLLIATRWRPSRIVEARAGIGAQTGVLHSLFPEAELLGFERDPAVYATNPYLDAERPLVQNMAFPEGTNFEGARDVLLVYDSEWTPKRPVRVAKYGARRAIVTDVSRGKWHLNFASYGMTEPTWSEYIRVAEPLLGMRIVAYREAPRSITYLACEA